MPQINGMQPASGQKLRNAGTVFNEADYFDATMGGMGCKVIVTTDKTDADAGTSFKALQCLTDTVLAAYTTRTYAPITPLNALVGVTIAAGTILFGQFTSITLTSGTLIAYIGVNNADN